MNRLLELRKEKNLSQRDMAREMSVSQATYHNWETAGTEPSVEQLIALADFFDVSVDYLIGRTDDYGAPARLPARDPDGIFAAVGELDAPARKALAVFLKTLSPRER